MAARYGSELLPLGLDFSAPQNRDACGRHNSFALDALNGMMCCRCPQCAPAGLLRLLASSEFLQLGHSTVTAAAQHSFVLPQSLSKFFHPYPPIQAIRLPNRSAYLLLSAIRLIPIFPPSAPFPDLSPCSPSPNLFPPPANVLLV